MPPSRIAFATTFYFDSGSFTASCGLIKWCFSAQRLSSMPAFSEAGLLTDVLVFTNNASRVRSQCSYEGRATRVVLYPAELVELARTWAAEAAPWWKPPALASGGSSWPVLGRPSSRRLVKQALLKWHALSHTEYDAMLLTDADVDFALDFAGVPPAALTRVWRQSLLDFLHAETEQISCYPDQASPINTGVLLLKPNRTTWAAGMRALRSMRWSGRMGFEHAGTLRARMRAPIEWFCGSEHGSEVTDSSRAAPRQGPTLRHCNAPSRIHSTPRTCSC